MHNRLESGILLFVLLLKDYKKNENEDKNEEIVNHKEQMRVENVE